MLCYKDRTYCINPNCTCASGRKLTDEVQAAANAAGLPVCYGNLCGDEPLDELLEDTECP